MLSVKVLCQQFTQVFSAAVVQYRTHHNEPIAKFLKEHEGDMFLYLNHDSREPISPEPSFLSLKLDEGENSKRYLILAPAWIYVMNESGKTVDQAAVN